MTQLMRSALTLALFLSVIVVAAEASAQADDFEWRGRVAPGQTLEIRGIAGAVVAELARGDEVEVTARKRGDEADLSDVRVEVVPHEGGVTICAVYGTPAGAREESRCGGGHATRAGTADVRVDFTVRVPAGVRLEARTVNGSIEARDLRSEVVARTVSGRVDVSTTEAAQARTVSGSITATVGSLARAGELSFQSVSGSVTVRLPADAGARVHMRTVSGGLESDFPMMLQGRISPRRFEATIGDGGPGIVMRTVSGNVRLRRGV